MIKINYESDFKLTETTEEQRFADVPFKFVYSTNSGTYTASYDGTTYINCKRNEDGSVTVIFNKHGLGVGKLKVRREFFIPDEDFPDGVYNVVSNDTTDVILVEGKTEGFDVEETFRPPYIEGGGEVVSVEVVDNLDSDATDKALSARQGKELKGMIPTKVSELENDEGYITELPDNIATTEDVSKAVSGKQDALTLTVKNNGNIVIGNIAGQFKEFMPATPSGDPMHYAYVSAGAEYNATDDFILKDAPWKDMVDTIEDKAKWGLDVVDASKVKQMTIKGVEYNYATENRTSPEGGTYLRYFIVGKGSNGVWVEDETKVLHLPKCWYLNGLGDITNAEMRSIYAVKHMSYATGGGFAGTPCRTFIDRIRHTGSNISCGDRYHRCKIVESIYSKVERVANAGFNYAITSTTALKYFLPAVTLMSYINTIYGAFGDASLRVLYIAGVQTAIQFPSKYISKASILYTINNVAPDLTSAITITLHHDAYARIANQPDILAALEAKPLVTLVSA